MMDEIMVKKKGNGSCVITDWKHSQVSTPEDVDGLSYILSHEIEKDMDLLERRLQAYWKKRKRSY